MLDLLCDFQLKIFGVRSLFWYVLATLAAAALLGAMIGLVPSVVVAAAALGLAWLFLLIRHWPVSALLSMAVSVAVCRYVVQVQGVSVTAERVVAVVVAGLLIVRARKDLSQGRRVGWCHAGLVGLIAANGLGALLNAPLPTESLRLSVLIAVSSLPFGMLPWLAGNLRLVVIGFWTLVILGVAQASLGLLAVRVFTTTGVDLGVQTDWLTGSVSPYGSMWESNVFGSFVAAGLVAALGWSLATRGRRRQRCFVAVGLGVMLLALAVSLSRGAWLGAAAGAAVTLMWAPKKVALLILVGCAISVILAVLVQSTIAVDPGMSPILNRATYIGDLLQGKIDGVTFTDERLYTYALALQGWLDHPIIGWGAGAFGQRYTYMSLNMAAWIGNLELHALYDSGLVGLFALLVVMLGTIIRTFRAAIQSSRDNDPNRGMLVGLLGACVALVVAFQATEATWLAYTWFVFGLAWTASRFASHARETTVSAARADVVDFQQLRAHV